MNKIAGITFNEEGYKEVSKNYFESDKHYIVRYKTIYQIFYSQNAGLYAQKIYQGLKDEKIGYTLKGRFIFANAEYVNKLVDFELLNIKEA